MISSNKNLKVTVPKDWSELNDTQLISFFNLMTKVRFHTIEDIMVTKFFDWSGLSTISSTRSETIEIKFEGKRYVVLKSELVAHIQKLDYLKQMPSLPVRVSSLHGHKAADATLEDATFETYIACDNLYQGYMQTEDSELLQQMCELLYSHNEKYSEAERIMVFYWWTGLKTYFSAIYSDLFQPAPSQNLISKPIELVIKDSINAQLRALTGGDITKEHEVLQQPVNRALTELNARAKEYEDMKRKTK